MHAPARGCAGFNQAGGGAAACGPPGHACACMSEPCSSDPRQVKITIIVIDLML
jgi:hypothetical protein